MDGDDQRQPAEFRPSSNACNERDIYAAPVAALYGGARVPLCVIYGSIVVECGRVQLVDGYGRSGSFAMLDRMKTYSSQVTGTRTRVRELVTYSRIYGDGRPPANQRYGTGEFNEAFLIGYEWWTEPIYDNSWSDFPLSQHSQTQQQQTQKTPLSKNDINHLRKDLKDIASDELCNSFITSVLKALSSTGQAAYETTDIFKLFEEVFTNEKNTLTWENISAHGLTVTGSASWGDYVKMQLQIEAFGVSRGLLGSDKRSHGDITSTTRTVVHELIHAYGKKTFGHQAMAEVAQSAAKKLWGTAGALPIREDYPSGGFDEALSKYFGDYLWKACYRGWTGKRK